MTFEDDELTVDLTALSPLALLELQSMHSDAVLTGLLSHEQAQHNLSKMGEINAELFRRGRCIYCGMQHTHTACHRITGKSLEDDEPPEDLYEGVAL